MENREILKRPVIDPAAIDSRQFTASLLREAERVGLADRSFVKLFQRQLLTLLHAQLQKQLGGNSGSVPVEFADEWMDGIVFCIDTALRESPTLEKSVSLLLRESVEVLFERGKQQLDVCAKACVGLLSRVRATRLHTVNLGYQTVLNTTYSDFLKAWKNSWFPHDFEVITEYPLAIEPPETGIAGVHAWLSALALENRFCARWPAEDVEALLEGYADAHRVSAADAFVNLFTLCLQNQLLNLLLRRTSLTLTKEDRVLLEQKLKSLQSGQRAALIEQAGAQLLKNCAFHHLKLEEYVRQAVRLFAQQLELTGGDLQELSVVTPEARGLIHIDGERLEDDAFAMVVDGVLLAETAEEKVRILQSELRSLHDLKDLLASGAVFEEEFAGIYALLDPLVLAMLLTAAPVTIDGDMLTAQADEEWQCALVGFLNGLDSVKRAQILSLYRSATHS